MISQPSAPNPYATAAAQNQQNQSASQFNAATGNVNEVNPFGTVSYRTIEQVPIYTNGVVSGYAPRYERTTALSPDQQKLHGLETQGKYNMGTTAVEQSAKLRDHLNTGLDPSKWSGWQTDIGTADRAGIEKAMMDSYNRNTASTERSQEASLAARGLSPGSQGYGGYQMQRDDNRAEAARKAYLTSGDEARQMAGYYNNLRGGQMQEAVALRNQPINEITALMSGGQATIPQFQPFQSSPTQAANIAQYISDNYKAQSSAAATTNAGYASMAGGLARLIPGF